jgi:trimethylamine--corrinoid protein Co-methyltransferase
MLKGFSRKIRAFDILTEQQVQAIHSGVLQVLEKTGLNFFHERALKLFAEHGCEVDFDTSRVRMPGHLVEECLRRTPSSFEMKARDSKSDLRIGGDTLYYMGGAALRIVDINTWDARPATLKELDEACVILDSLDSVHMFADTAPYTDLVGVPAVMTYLMDTVSHVKNSTKITLSAGSHGSEAFNVKIAKTIGADMLAFLGVSAPLTYQRDACEATFIQAEAGFPFYIVASDMMGGTGPATIAGSLITTTAEILAGLVLLELIRPGTGVVAGDYTMPLNMRTGEPCFDDVGSSLHTVAFNQIMRRYKIPIFANCPGMSCAKTIDVQSGYERGMSSLAAAMSGANIIVLHGSVYGEYTFHPVQAVLDDDIANWVGRFIQGFEVNDETMATRLIDEVGPIPGSYLNKAHTRKWWKTQQFIPKTGERSTYLEWVKTGKKTALAYARERMEEILRNYKPVPLPRDQNDQVDRVVKEAEGFYRKAGLL